MIVNFILLHLKNEGMCALNTANIESFRPFNGKGCRIYSLNGEDGACWDVDESFKEVLSLINGDSDNE